ncbi:MAG: hypothetical protein AAF789_06840 [Bacteroidota bacterium]
MKTILFVMLQLLFLVTQAQEGEERIDDAIDRITYDWDAQAELLQTYEGLSRLCDDAAYRDQIFSLLKEIHHYDTVLYGVLRTIRNKKQEKEIKKTLKDIESFEDTYSTKAFARFMNEECKARREIENEADNTRNQVGIYSYSGQTYVLETELFKYVKHVTDKVDKIRKHVHHLSE